MAEVIDLCDDDIVVEEVSLRKVATPAVKRPFRCLNSDCRSEKDLVRAEEFVRRYYGVLSYPKKKRVCRSCCAEANNQQDSLVETVRLGRLLLAEKLPPPKETVVLTDSDSDPSDNEISSEESEYEFDCEEGKTLEETIAELTRDLGLDTQIIEGTKHLEERFAALEDGFEKLHKEDYTKIETHLDTIRKDFYSNFQPNIRWLPPLDIGPSSALIQEGSEVIAEPAVCTPAHNLPPIGPLVRIELKPNEVVFSMKYSLFARWVEAQVIEVEKREPKNTSYKIRYNRNAKSSGLPRVMTGRQLAYFTPCPTRIPVGTRVIAKYRDDDPKNTSISGSFYVGIVAEVPTAANKYRYLIFFDDGYAQYVLHGDIRVVTEASSCSWEDVSSDSKEFIKEYLQMYPERPMVRLQKYNYVKTEWNGRWWKALVKEVDGSLVKMFFPMDGRAEWIYRGSTRLSPLFNKKLNTQAQTEQPLKTIRRRTVAVPGRAVVEYGTFGQGLDTETTAPEPGERRAVARKSTMSRAGTPPREVQQRMEQESRGITKKHTLPEKTMKYNKHVCSWKCLGSKGDNMIDHRGLSPLLYPVLFGWYRHIVKQRRKSITRNEVYYVAPCGRRLRSIEEVFRYLRDTESNLEIDCFSFEMAVDTTHEWEPFKKIVHIDDVSIGEENVQISCVNSLDETAPQTLVYCKVRIPTEHVPLNLNPEFLICCDCTDNCQDKTKCACWQLTFEGTKILDRAENSNVGYHYRRLSEQVPSGIYECNSRCKCSIKCLNRVVQHPLRLKLQLFKTARRGWGVRTLHDIPKGGFICVYVGKMLNETIANEEGKMIAGGDDYYAELDYIEVMENAKEGYEEEAENIEEDSGKIFNAETTAVTATSDSTDSDGFYSENEVDDPKDDQDFSHPTYMKKVGFAKREKSARLQERVSRNLQKKKESKDASGSGSAPVSDEEASKGTQKETESKDDHKPDAADEFDDEDEADEKQRRPQTFVPSQLLVTPPKKKSYKSVREYFGRDEAVYIMDAKHTGNIGRFLNHSCEPNVFVQNVFVDTHDIRFPWVAFFAMNNIVAGTELTWDYSYEVDSVPGKIKYCYCGAKNCRGRLL